MADKAKGKTKTWDDSKYRDYRGKWANKKEYDIVNEVRDRFQEMASARKTSCPWASPFTEVKINSDEVDSDEIGTGTNWADRWNLDDKLFMMYHDYERDRSNLKSPTSFSPIQAALAEFQANDVGVLFSATRPEDEGKMKLNKYIHEDWENRFNVKQYKKTTFQETITRGTSIPFNGWMIKSRTVEYILSSGDTKKEMQKKLDERNEEVEEAKKKIMEDMTPLTKKEELIEYNNCIYVPTSLFEIYVDPDARTLRGPMYEAADIAWRQLPSVEQFRSEFINSKDPYVIKKNVDKVRSAPEAQDSYEDSDPFFNAPEDISGNKVELIRYFNKQTDKYYIIANDILVREGPLPYNHKELPFSRHVCYELKDQFYGAGMPVMLESLQSEDETIRNMALDHLKIKLNPPLFITTDIYNDVDLGWEEIEPGLKVEIGGDVGPSSVRWFDAPPIGFDFYRMRDGLKEDEIKTSGINPTAYSMPRPNEPVRTHILSMESTLKMVKKMMQNWGDGWVNTTRQLISVREQMLPETYIEKFTDDDKKVRTYPTIKTGNSGISISYDEDNDMVLMNEERLEEDNGYFNLKDLFDDNRNLLSLQGDMDIQLDLDSMVPRSHGLKIEQLDKAMAVLIPLLTNPKALEAPGITQLIKDFVRLNGIDQRVVEQLTEESTEQQEEYAKQQEEEMFAGNKVQGIPGESANHLMHHMRTMMALINEKETITESTNQTDELGNQLQPDPKTIAQVAQIDEVIAILTEHMSIDNTPRPDSIGLSIESGQNSINPPEPESPGAPSGPEGMSPMGPEGMMPPGMGGAPGGMPPMGGMPGAGGMGGPSGGPMPF